MVYYDAASSFAVGMLGLLAVIALFIILLAFLFKAVRGSYSLQYRKQLVNLFVAGKVRQLADKEKVDLKVEELNCDKYVAKLTKLNSRKVRDLDDKIEVELMKQIEDTYPEEKKK